MKMKDLSLVVILSVSGCGESQKSSVKEVKDSASIQLRSDGKYDVICKNGAFETVTVENIRANNICSKNVNPQSNILSVQMRDDGKFNVICKGNKTAVASDEDIILNRVCKDPAVIPGTKILESGTFKGDCTYTITTAAINNLTSVKWQIATGSCLKEVNFSCAKLNEWCTPDAASAAYTMKVLNRDAISLFFKNQTGELKFTRILK